MNQLKENRHFPGFESALNPEIICTLLEKALIGINQSLRVTNCSVQDVKYNPGRQCSILYEVDFHDTFFQRSWKHLVAARALMSGEEPSFNTQPFHFSERERIAFFLFPNDPMISWLPEMINEQTMIQQLNRHWTSKNLKALKMSCNLLGYTPQMRATFDYHFKLENRERGKREDVNWIGKTNYFKPANLNHAKHYAIWKAAKGEISISKPIDFLPFPRIAFQEKLQGEKLGALIQSDRFTYYLQETAKTIAHFHSLNVPLANARSVDSEIASLTRWCDVIKNIRTDIKPRIETLHAKISSELENRIHLSSPIHADFHPSNILVEGDKVHLIDLDEMAFGDPCSDIGRFLSSLRMPSKRAFGSLEGYAPLREMIIETYLKKMKVDPRKIHLFEAASLITSAGTAFRLQRPNWMEDALLLIEESEKCLKSACENPAVPVQKTPYLPTAEEKISWCQDLNFMLAHLNPFFEKKWKVELFDCECIKQKETYSAYRFTYKTASWKGDTKVKKKILLFLPKKSIGKIVFNDLKKRKEENLPSVIGYIQELDAIVTGYQEGVSFSDIQQSPSRNLQHRSLQS